LSDGVELTKFTVNVEEAVGNIDVPTKINLVQGDSPKSLSEFNFSIKGKENSLLPLNKATCNILDSEIASVTNTCDKITAGKPGDTNLVIKSGQVTKYVLVDVAEKPSSIRITAINNPELEIRFPNKPLRLLATVYDLANQPIPNPTSALDWQILSDGDSKDYVKLNKDINSNTATITAIKQVNDYMVVKIKVCLNGSTTACDTVTASISNRIK
jgi:hypothetical protein